MHGAKEFAAIIPPGCTAALAIGAVRDAPVVRAGRLEAGRICALTLSADHRVVDGVTAARFLQSMRNHLESL
jgi:pyruvate dehydrogenase E2 component (dihydrolipoamide acetyltransferase)